MLAPKNAKKKRERNNPTMHNVLLLAFEYMKIGAVAIGGGYTVIPFLYYLVEKYHWFNVAEITQMIAVSNLTPGPIGINMATFVGVKVGGIIGSAFTTIAFMIPSVIIICCLAKFLKKNQENKYINFVMYGLRPAAVALIGVAGLKIMNTTFFHFENFKTAHNLFDIISLKALILLVIFTAIGLKMRKNPMILIVLAIIAGCFIKV